MESSMGKRIADLRKKKGLTQDQLAEQFSVSAQAVSKWENDISCPDIMMLPQLADFFHISIDELLRGRQEESVRMVPKGERKELDDMMLKVIVDSQKGDRVRINLPILLVKVGVEIGMQIPEVANNTALQQVDFAKIFELVEQGVIGKLVEVDSAEGEHVEVVVE